MTLVQQTGRASLVVTLLAVAGGGCGGPIPAVERGADRFGAASLSSSPSNAFACATCHATSAADPRRLSGYRLDGTTTRPTWWGGSYNYLLDAVNECLVEFMRGAPLTPEDEDGRALLAYLQSLPSAGPDAGRALPLTVVKNLDAAYYASLPSGDAARGATLYAAACLGCHGAIHTGAGRLGSFMPIIPDETMARHGTDAVTGARPITIEKLRHGKFFLAGGNMPLYSLEALSDQELADLLAHLGY